MTFTEQFGLALTLSELCSAEVCEERRSAHWPPSLSPFVIFFSPFRKMSNSAWISRQPSLHTHLQFVTHRVNVLTAPQDKPQKTD
jgi:hypothetical protein